jgi:hypothetical protein
VPAGPPSLVDIAAGVGGPFALAGAALAYLGWVRSQAHVSAVGIDAEIWGQQDRDDALGAVAWLIGPLLLLATAGLLLAVADHWLAERAARRRDRTITRTARAARAVAAVAAALAVLGFLRPTSFPPGVVPILLTAAVGLWLYPRRLDRLCRSAQPLPWAVLFAAKLLASVLAIWAATDFAIASGYRLATNTVAGASTVVLYAEKDLHLAAAGVHTQLLPYDADRSAYAVAYRGLRMLSYTPGQRIVLVSEDWRPRAGQIIVLPDDGSFRVEYGSGAG